MYLYGNLIFGTRRARDNGSWNPCSNQMTQFRVGLVPELQQLIPDDVYRFVSVHGRAKYRMLLPPPPIEAARPQPPVRKLGVHQELALDADGAVNAQFRIDPFTVLRHRPHALSGLRSARRRLRAVPEQGVVGHRASVGPPADRRGHAERRRSSHSLGNSVQTISERIA